MYIPARCLCAVYMVMYNRLLMGKKQKETDGYKEIIFIMNQEDVVLCGSSAYTKKYYLNPEFQKLPQGIQDELKLMCVLYTEDVGGTLTLKFDEDGELIFETAADEGDLLYDEIGSVLKVKQLQNNQQELLESLEMYYKVTHQIDL